jgi:hypothetical protein
MPVPVGYKLKSIANHTSGSFLVDIVYPVTWSSTMALGQAMAIPVCHSIQWKLDTTTCLFNSLVHD